MQPRQQILYPGNTTSLATSLATTNDQRRVEIVFLRCTTGRTKATAHNKHRQCLRCPILCYSTLASTATYIDKYTFDDNMEYRSWLMPAY